MPRKAKVVTPEQVHNIVLILKAIKAQANKEPLSKKELAEVLGLKTVEILSEIKRIEKLALAIQRNGPDPKAIYYKITAKGAQSIKAWELLYS